VGINTERRLRLHIPKTVNLHRKRIGARRDVAVYRRIRRHTGFLHRLQHSVRRVVDYQNGNFYFTAVFQLADNTFGIAGLVHRGNLENRGLDLTGFIFTGLQHDIPIGIAGAHFNILFDRAPFIVQFGKTGFFISAAGKEERAKDILTLRRGVHLKFRPAVGYEKQIRFKRSHAGHVHRPEIVNYRAVRYFFGVYRQGKFLGGIALFLSGQRDKFFAIYAVFYGFYAVWIVRRPLEGNGFGDNIADIMGTEIYIRRGSVKDKINFPYRTGDLFGIERLDIQGMPAVGDG